MSHVMCYKLHDARECVLPPGNLWKPPASSTPFGSSPRAGGYPLPPRTARKRAASRLCPRTRSRSSRHASTCRPPRAAKVEPPFTPSRGDCRAKVRPASGPTLAGRHAASSAPSPAMLRLRRHIAGDMRSYTHFSTLYPSASKKLTITKFEIWTMIFPFKVVHNSSSIKKFKTSCTSSVSTQGMSYSRT